MNEGEHEPHPSLEQVLEAVAGSALQRTVKATEPTALHLAEHAFWHGSAVFDRHQAIFFYFEDIDMGLVGIELGPSDKHALFVRFSLVKPVGLAPIFSSSGPRGQG